MVFCSKCGAILMGTVCSRCGGTNNVSDSKKESDNGESGSAESGNGNSAFSGSASANSPFSSGATANNPFGGTKFGGAFGFGSFGKSGFGNTSYGTEEDVAEKNKKSLISKLERYKELLDENEELETLIKPQSSFPDTDETGFKKRSFMKYFWPFLVAGPVAGYLLYFIATMITMSSIKSYAIQAETDPSIATSRLMGDTFMGFVLALIVAAAIIIFGVIISKRKQAEQNSKADYMNREASERYQKGLENKRMIDLKQSNIQEMRQYESLVPNEYRTAIRVGKIIGYIKDGDADSVDAAIEKIKSEPAPEPAPEPAVDLNGIFS